MNFVADASKTSGSITHCLEEWTVHRRQHPKSSQSYVEPRKGGKENCATRFRARYGAFMAGRTSVRHLAPPQAIFGWAENLSRAGRGAPLLTLSISTVRNSVQMWQMRQLHDLPSVLQVRISVSSDAWFSNFENVEYSEVHDLHPNDPFLELRVMPLRWGSPSSVSSIFVCNSCSEVRFPTTGFPARIDFLPPVLF
jgi:hypothetical protein